MGITFVNNREVKRVALDFDWPIGKGKVWKGYIAPPERQCRHCDYGASEAYMHIEKHVNAMFFDSAARSDPQYKAILQALAGRAPLSAKLGHDVVDRNNAVLKLGELAGLPKNWEFCPHCGGHGIEPGNEWQPFEPPSGAGWQLWETTTEGSPESPVLGSADELADWMTKHGYAESVARELIEAAS